jgi:hypothetical protein
LQVVVEIDDCRGPTEQVVETLALSPQLCFDFRRSNPSRQQSPKKATQRPKAAFGIDQARYLMERRDRPVKG